MALQRQLFHLKRATVRLCGSQTGTGSEELTKKRGCVTMIRLATASGGRLTVSGLERLSAAVDAFEVDASSPVAVLHGSGGSFLNGYDPDDLEKALQTADRLGLLDRYVKKPIVAAVNGYAVGVGLDLALWCDFRVVEETAVLGYDSKKLGLPVNEAKAKRAVAALGLRTTVDLLLTGRLMKAKEAFESGVADRLVPCGTAIGQGINFANTLVHMPQACLKADRATVFSLSRKFSEETRKKIRKEASIWSEKALEECFARNPATQNGNVRRKHDL